MRRVLTIAVNTYRESMRSKVLYSLLVFAILVIAASAFFGSVSIGDQIKVIKDFGLFAVSLFTVIYAVISGSILLHKELSRKTIYNVLSKPVRRCEFLLGKYLGILATATVMLVLTAVGLISFIALIEPQFSLPLILAFYHIFLELMIICAAAIFFSSIVVTPMLIGLFTFGLFLAGRSASLILYLIAEELIIGFGVPVLKGVYYILPHLEMLNISNEAVYELAVPIEQVIWSTVYALGYASILLTFATFLFNKREFN